MAKKVILNINKNDKAAKMEENTKTSRYYDQESMDDLDAVTNEDWKMPVLESPTYPVQTTAASQPQNERVGAGRPKIQRNIQRNKAMNVYFDSDTHQLLKNMKFYHNIEMKDIPYVLTREFFKKYEVDGKLNAEGIAYLQKLLAEVN